MNKGNLQGYKIIRQEKPSFYFIGVTTTKSSIMKLFPLWMAELGFPEVQIIGCDLKIHDGREKYRQAVAQIKFDGNSLGALVTTHKMDLFNAAEDIFDWFDPYARLLHEISCISKKNGKLEGHAKDPTSSGLTMDSILGKDYFQRTGVDVLIFGAGGSSIATVLHLINKKNKGDRPSRIIVVNRSKPRLDHLREILKNVGTRGINIEYILNEDPLKNDNIMADLNKCSIVINATGLGKDRPGSPITDDALFPINGIAWEFNYRGELNFMHQAKHQGKSRGVKVEDGWTYFIHGWTQVIFQVLHLKMTPTLFNKLSDIAATIR